MRITGVFLPEITGVAHELRLFVIALATIVTPFVLRNLVRTNPRSKETS